MKIALVANTDWYLYNYRLAFAAELAQQGRVVTLVCPPGDYHELLTQQGFTWLPLNVSRKGMNPILELVSVLKLSSLYRAEQFDVIHHFTIKPVLYGSMAAKLAGVPYVINSITGLGYTLSSTAHKIRALKTFLLSVLRFALRGTRVIFQNPEHRDLFLGKGIVTQDQASLVMGSGVDLTRFAYAPEPDGVPIVALPSRLIWEKGVREFVGAVASIKKRGNASARFVLVGAPDPGNPTSIPQSVLEEWQAEGVVEWWGWRQDMPEVLRSVHIVCLPSWYAEGLPRVLLEAASVGRAVVATDIPGSREVVRHGENGLLIPSRNQGALAEAIETLLLNPQLRQKMGQVGRGIVQAEFSLARINAETLAVYPNE